jgi:hypothetical protein
MNKQEALLRQTIREMASSTEAEQQSRKETLLREAVRAMLLNEIGPDVDYGDPLLSLFKPIVDVANVIKSELSQLSAASRASVTATLKGFQNVFRGRNFFDAQVARILEQGQERVAKIEKEYADSYANIDASFLDAVGHTFLVDPGLALSALAGDKSPQARAMLRNAWAALFGDDSKDSEKDLFDVHLLKVPDGSIAAIEQIVKNLKLPHGIDQEDSRLYVTVEGEDAYGGLENAIDLNGVTIRSRRSFKTGEKMSGLPDAVAKRAMQDGTLVIFSEQESSGTGGSRKKGKQSKGKREPALGFETLPLAGTLPADSKKEPGKATDIKQKMAALGDQIFSGDKDAASAATGEAIKILRSSNKFLVDVLETQEAAAKIKEVALQTAQTLVEKARSALSVKSMADAKKLLPALGPQAKPLQRVISDAEREIKKLSADPKQKGQSSKIESTFLKVWRDQVKKQYLQAIDDATKDIPTGSELDKIYTAAAQKIASL